MVRLSVKMCCLVLFIQVAVFLPFVCLFICPSSVCACMCKAQHTCGKSEDNLQELVFLLLCGFWGCVGVIAPYSLQWGGGGMAACGGKTGNGDII